MSRETSKAKKIAKFYDNILNKRIKALLEEKQIKTNEFAKALSVTPEAVRLWCSGYARPDIDKLLLISDFFGVSADYMLGISDVKSTNTTIKEGDIKMNENPDYQIKRDMETLIRYGELLLDKERLNLAMNTIKSEVEILNNLVELHPIKEE